MTFPIPTFPTLFCRDLSYTVLLCKAGIVMSVSHEAIFIPYTVTLSLCVCVCVRVFGPPTTLSDLCTGRIVMWHKTKAIADKTAKILNILMKNPAISSWVITKVLCICENMYRSKHLELQDK